jgi:hypothetical protein
MLIGLMHYLDVNVFGLIRRGREVIGLGRPPPLALERPTPAAAGVACRLSTVSAERSCSCYLSPWQLPLSTSLGGRHGHTS